MAYGKKICVEKLEEEMEKYMEKNNIKSLNKACFNIGISYAGYRRCRVNGSVGSYIEKKLIKAGFKCDFITDDGHIG